MNIEDKRFRDAVLSFAMATNQSFLGALTTIVKAISSVGQGLKVYGIDIPDNLNAEQREDFIYDVLNDKFVIEQSLK